MSLHQIHARSPRRVPVPRPGTTAPTVGRYHQFIRAVLVGPSSIGSGSRNIVLNFDVSAEVLLRAAAGYFEGAVRYRFRMCAIPFSKANSVSEDTWVTTPTNWPEHVFVTFNKTAAPIRRKAHHRVSQPIELTPLLQLGQNTLHLSILQKAKPKESNVYFAAHGTIAASVTPNLVAERVKSAEIGDELVIMDSTVSIDLNDPFTMRMFKVPTRTGKPLCHHRGRQMCEACRSFENLGPEPTLPDGWKCPICSSEARPRSLRVDLFLCHVRDHLPAEGKAEAKSISVHPNGSWTAKIEEGLDSADEDVPLAKRRKRDAPGKDKGPRSAMEATELD
ncbi:hypothetical protein B0T11DRAFT_315244 [Plectosphaerella cucumerina]|uniref:ZMIZ1/ZMIZ2 GBD-like domain-containing protein n=1 Tax=Plectosphaerella cucumerina TaxID=40658 RepID=A0A8K0TWI9_9PEZI|nr:hypothetical protein B0T11DRAFT_315244 [Plectosphaerella cucumerina]